VKIKILSFSFFFLISVSLILASWYVLHGDLHFSSDIARDFLLYEEISAKKFILIGPRSSVSGLFHGPLWLYVNYPAFLLGKGNPVVVGWYWILLVATTLVGYYVIAKKMFGELSAKLFVLMTALYMVFQTSSFINPYGAMLALPFFFFFFVRYLQTLKPKFLVTSILLVGALVQFQIAIGSPFFILTFLYCIPFLYKKKKIKHLLLFFVILIPLSTFLLFDVKHGFLLTHSAIRHLQTHDSRSSFVALLKDRINILFGGIEFLRYGPANGSLYVGVLLFIFTLLQIKQKKNELIYKTFLYFYVGYYVMSFLNRYGLLYFYVFPLFPFAFLIFSSFANSKFKTLFLVIFFTMYFVNFLGVIDYVQREVNFTGKSQDSWKSQLEVAQGVFSKAENEFGYFVYSPDVLGYSPKYAMDYVKTLYPNKKAESFIKRPVTYLVIAPPPSDNPFMQDDWWRKNQLNIKSEPVLTIHFPDGYKVEKLLLTNDELNVSFDPAINPGLHFR